VIETLLDVSEASVYSVEGYELADHFAIGAQRIMSRFSTLDVIFDHSWLGLEGARDDTRIISLVYKLVRARHYQYSTRATHGLSRQQTQCRKSRTGSPRL